MTTTAVLGIQWGDEGKAKVVDALSHEADVVVRFQGGANAGHTVEVGADKFVFHLVPAGIINPHTTCVIGNGVVVDPQQLFKELGELDGRGIPQVRERLLISQRAHIVFPYHKMIDELRETAGKQDGGQIGTTKRGIGPCYGDKTQRIGIRVCDLLEPEYFKTRLQRVLAEKNAIIEKVYGGQPFAFDALYNEYLELGNQLRPMVTSTGKYLHAAHEQGRKILFEGAQGAMLDLDHGTYPYVTSSTTSAANMLTGTGSWLPIDRTIGIIKAYTTRVGEGPFPTELHGTEADTLREAGGEFGSTTGRPRRIGWFDAVAVRYAARVSGVTELCVTKLDVLAGRAEIKVACAYEGLPNDDFPADLPTLKAVEPQFVTFPGFKEDISKCRRFSELPANAQTYLTALEGLLGMPIRTVSVGPKREQTIYRT